MNTKDQALKKIEDFLVEADMSPSKFGTAVMNDSRFVFRLRQPNADIMASTIDQCLDFIADWRKQNAPAA